jgi:outer membrane protein insertion porin family
VPGGASGPAAPGLAPPPFALSEEEPTIEIPVIAQVQESQTGRLMLGVGVNSSSGLMGQVTIEEQNFDWRRVPTSWEDIRNGSAFRGGGQQFRIQAMPGTQLSQYSATFREPYFLDTLVSFTLSASFFNRFFQNWVEQRGGGRIGFGYQFTPDLHGQFALRGENVTIYDPTVPTPPELQAVLGNNDLFTAKFDIIHDTRDSPFLPTQGHYIDLSYEQAFGQFTYPRATIDSRKYFLMRQRPDRSGRHVLTLMNTTGFTGSNTPIFENFYAGGYQTMRGFYFRGASPLDMGVQVGGNFEFLNTIEYMMPLTSDDMLRVVTFCDFGTVEREVALQWDQFRIAPGIGLRIQIPAMGPAPIALDFAVPVHWAAGDTIQNFSFFVGTQR